MLTQEEIEEVLEEVRTSFFVYPQGGHYGNY